MKKLAEGQRQMKNLSNKLLAVAVGVAMFTAPVHAEQGVTDTEILIGSNNDLSGPFAAFN